MPRRTLQILTVVLVAALGALSGRAGAETVSIGPSADLGLPFWCDWSYDWEARCYRDEGPRLPVGGVDDKVWRAALRFDLDAIPAGATVTSAMLRLHHDGWCVAPRLTAIRCPWRSYRVNAHEIRSLDWFDEREPEIDFVAAAGATLPAGATFRWLAWNLTALVQSWHAGMTLNAGLALKLTYSEEDFGVSGPYFASSRAAEAGERPRLVVSYLPPSP